MTSKTIKNVLVFLPGYTDPYYFSGTFYPAYRPGYNSLDLPEPESIEGVLIDDAGVIQSDLFDNYYAEILEQVLEEV